MVMYAKAKLNEPMGLSEFQQIRRGMSIWMLQENAGFTFKEARVLMTDRRLESAEDLAKILGVTKQELSDIENSARAKIDGIKDLDAALNGYFPLVIDYSIRKCS